MRKACYRFRIDERTCRPLVATLEKNNMLRRFRHRWDDNIKKDFKRQNGRAWTGVM